ncbi:hypothetical protein B0X71_13870 [Planococcus lenghuensis]|uniref:D-alanyl-D-alanine carboxypeptidase-like core domain-containing protein n=1 Tax=Planococcus lenghuensis TaxID=2213202 RepID=A0A1Q2L2H2_9BACL|nr:hypothetical protein B0X71_13870 [Planococcus lenghuensis]
MSKSPGLGTVKLNLLDLLPSAYNPGVTPVAQKGVDAMIAAAKKQGVYLTMFSGFRAYERQKALYNNYVQQYGKTAAERFSACPGHSEHQSGLAFDLA